MKKIIPFKKDIIFKTNLEEIVSISLEHSLEKIDEHLISGDLTVSGEYKIAPTTTSVDKFSYALPFEINLDDRYDISKSIVDIDDFYYEITNNKVLSVSIDILVDKIEEIPEKDEEIDVRTEPEIIEIEEIEEEPVEDKRCVEEETSLFDNIDYSKEVYKSYKVYIVREGDTIEKIMEKYEVSKDILEEYNDLSEIKLNDKIIIPTICNEDD